jgi:hypothetical protein
MGAPSSSFFLLGCLGFHSSRPGRSCLRTLQDPGAGNPQWHHSQVFPDCSDNISTASKAPPPPVSGHLCVSFPARHSDLGIAFSSMFSPQLVQGWNGMTFLSCFKELPIWNSQYGGHKDFLLVSTKASQGLCSQIRKENYLKLGWGNFPLGTTSPIMWESIPLCGILPGFFVPNFKKTHKHTHWLARASQWAYEFTLFWSRKYITLIWEIHRHTQTIPK